MNKWMNYLMQLVNINELKKQLKRRLKNILIAIDQFIYVLITLGHGDPDETISSAAYRGSISGKWFGKIGRPIIDFLFSGFEDEHCKKAYLSECERRSFTINDRRQQTRSD